MAISADNLTVIGVVGAGAMGSGIAQIGLAAGLRVIVFDSNQAALAPARDQILARLRRQVEKGQLPEDGLAQAARNLILAAELPALASAQIIIEAIVEKLEAKQALFVALEKVVSPDAILATNTSSLSVAAIARVCERRGRVCGMHFFNPVPLMQLVEVVGTPDTDSTIIDCAMSLAKKLGKSAVRVKDVPGFLVNLLGRAYTTEALHILLEGVATVDVIDRIMRDATGFRMGPFELMDLTGIDVNFPATTAIYQGFQHDPRLKTTILHEQLFNAGCYGRKAGRGFHRYDAEGPATAPEEPAAALPGVAVFAADDEPGLAALIAAGLSPSSQAAADVLLIAPKGEDAATVTARRGFDPARVVAVDLIGLERKFLTLMSPLGGGECATRLAGSLRRMGYVVVVVGDSPGFVAPRILAMVANLGCEVAQMGIGTPEDVDLAMKLAQNYPRGPLEWAAWLGPARVYETLCALQNITGSDRYRPSLWLRRRVQLGLPVHTPSQ